MCCEVVGARGSVAGWGSMLQAGRSPVRVPDEVVFFNWPNPSRRIMALESTQPLTEMNTRNLPGSKKRPKSWLTTLLPSVSRMSENVGAPTSHSPKGLLGLYRDNFTLPYLTLPCKVVKWMVVARPRKGQIKQSVKQAIYELLVTHVTIYFSNECP
jgi:hypothetical protein